MPLTIAQALQQACSLGLPRIDAQLLLLHALGQAIDTDRSWLLRHDTETLSSNQQQHWQQLVQRRLAGEPIAYLRGFREFFGLQLAVDKRVLDPRPDTETLVEWALALLPLLEKTPEQTTHCVADLGTGSGAIACAIAHTVARHTLHATVYASDSSADALAVAQDNAQRLCLPIEFALGNWFAAFSHMHPLPRFDLIVSNPPYIASNDEHLKFLQHEPQTALVAANHGLQDIQTLIQQAPDWLQTGGWLLLEHGYEQADAVQDLLKRRGFTQVQGRKDLAGIVRCSGGQWHNSEGNAASHKR